MSIPGNEISAYPSGKYFQKYLQIAESLLYLYSGGEPFHLYIKKYFSSHKKHGSGDRKQIASLCYNYFRLGHGVTTQLPMQEKLLLGTFLCDSKPSLALSQLKPGWSDMITCQLNEKLKIADDIFMSKNIFPFPEEISDQIDLSKFAISFLQQPKLFIRIRPGKEAIVLDKLRSAGFSFEKISDKCLVFAHNEKVTEVTNIDKEAVVQDYNSQRAGEFFSKYILAGQVTDKVKKIKSHISVWDCCAGSGGKSILAVDLLKNVDLTVTDSRPSILKNLKKRFAAAGIKNYHSSVSDLSGSVPPLPEGARGRQDLIIADVPCSGSGTWPRTPEQLNFFQENEIEKYALLQKSIVRNVVPHLRDGGILIYITCSVFKKENEENVDYILQNFSLNLLQMEYLKGYEMQADTLFVSVFRKS